MHKNIHSPRHCFPTLYFEKLQIYSKVERMLLWTLIYLPSGFYFHILPYLLYVTHLSICPSIHPSIYPSSVHPFIPSSLYPSYLTILLLIHSKEVELSVPPPPPSSSCGVLTRAQYLCVDFYLLRSNLHLMKCIDLRCNLLTLNKCIHWYNVHFYWAMKYHQPHPRDTAHYPPFYSSYGSIIYAQ